MKSAALKPQSMRKGVSAEQNAVYARMLSRRDSMFSSSFTWKGWPLKGRRSWMGIRFTCSVILPHPLSGGRGGQGKRPPAIWASPSGANSPVPHKWRTGNRESPNAPLLARKCRNPTLFQVFFPPQGAFDTDVGTEELGHLEMVGSIVHQLTRNMKDAQMKDPAFAPYFVDHTAGVYPQAASGTPWSAASMAVKGDPMADLVENMAAEQKARVTYDNILRLSDDPDVNDVIRFLREREIVHFQRFGEAIELLREKLDRKNVYYMNPAIDM